MGGQVVAVPVQKHVHVPQVMKIERKVEVPQVQYVDKDIEVPVPVHRHVPVISTVAKHVEVPVPLGDSRRLVVFEVSLPHM